MKKFFKFFIQAKQMQKILYVYAKFQSINDKMNKLLYTFLSAIAPFIVVAQELERADDGFPPGMKVDNYAETGIQISPGSELSPKDSTSVKLTVFLEGPFDKGKMFTELNKEDLIPLNQPYNVSPWYYMGTESVSEIPNDHVVDWVLVDIRSADSAGGATGETTFARKAGFLMSNGTICNPDGITLLSFDTVFS
jgi:hypothetical protein